MIDRGVPANRDGWPDGTLDALRQWEQGNLVQTPPFLYFADPQSPVWDATRAYTETSGEPEVILPEPDVCPPYGMVTTQTCDIAEEDAARPLRPWIQIAPVYQVTDWKKTKLQRRGPLFWILVPELPGKDPWVADLRIEVPVEKGWLAGQSRIDGFSDEAQRRRIGERLALVRGRHAFASEINPLIHAVRTLLGGEAPESDVHERTADAIEEVGLYLDNYLRPTSAQVVFLTTQAIDADSLSFLREWNDAQAERLAEQGIALQAIDVRQMEEVPATDYRRLSIIWRAAGDPA